MNDQNHLRAFMAPYKTSDLTLITVEYDISHLILQDQTRVINGFAGKNPRRFSNIVI